MSFVIGHSFDIRHWSFVIASLVLWLAQGPTQLQAQSEAFSYQGHLLDGQEPATGSYDLRFALYDASAGGNLSVGPLTNAPVNVSNGTFALTLDFGGGVFNGSARWLELAVRIYGSSNSYTVLSPRQAIIALPWAAYANRAGLSASLIGGGAGLTNIPGRSIQVGTITSNALSSQTDAAYRATDTNMVQLLGDARWASKAVINVKDFGAKGDGGTDDAIAISNAWAVLNSTGGTLYFPPGFYVDSGSHRTGNFRPNEPPDRDGRLVLGQGSVIWEYTGGSTQFLLSNSAPDFDGIEFLCGNPQAAVGCMYLAGPFSKWTMRNCFFNGWTSASPGTLLLDDADSVTLGSVAFYNCKIGLGIGFHCGNFKGDLVAKLCGVGAAVGVPTPRYPTERDSQDVRLTLLTAYCGASVAVDGGAGPITVEGFHWHATTPVVLGMIPGVSSNYAEIGAVTLEHSCFLNATTNAPVQLYSPVYPSLTIEHCSFPMGGTNTAIVQSFNTGADATRIVWDNSVADGNPGIPPMFQTSTGSRMAESADDQSRYLNKGLGLYNARPLTGEGGSGYVLDLLDSTRAYPASPVARIGVTASSGAAFADFSGGLVVRYDALTGRAAVEATNSDFYVKSGKLSATNDTTTVGDLTILGNLTAGNAAGITANIPFVTPDGRTNQLHIIKGILTGVGP